MDTPQAVSLNHISVTLGDTPVLHDISLSVAPGEFLSIIGPNGCGKSTLLKVICHMIRPQSGQACLYGRAPPYGYTDAETRHSRGHDRI